MAKSPRVAVAGAISAGRLGASRLPCVSQLRLLIGHRVRIVYLTPKALNYRHSQCGDRTVAGRRREYLVPRPRLLRHLRTDCLCFQERIGALARDLDAHNDRKNLYLSR
ncbi:hypothetical protein EXIGLDRAFT_462733 [Exidia glandulosa HHB12029]|uniref:Uncharacterized protein n=1 Tax=Exidia glandulosa HHB12029 TaxID=1314781 RepID=A0A165K417_EXIGL|nr:hypothetical protein EXIGLDRAFT_462733 [Exidia glandulosa HHB12029]